MLVALILQREHTHLNSHFVKDDKEVCAQIVTVNVQTPGVAGDSISYNLNINNSTGAAQTEEDAVVNADNMTARHFGYFCV